MLEGRGRKIQLSGITKFGKSQTLPHNLVEKVTVMEDVLGRATGQYVPQLVLKGFKGGGKKLVINCFPVEDIVQAHYTAQLLATFCRTDAFDYKGSQLPILSTFIPNRFRVNKGRYPQVCFPRNEESQGPAKKTGHPEDRYLIQPFSILIH